MPIHMLVTVYSVEGIGWKPGFRMGSPPKFYLEVVVGSQPLVSSKEVEIVDDVCTWKEKLPLVITSLDDTLQFRLRRHARVRKDPIFGTLDISAKELIEQSSGDSQGIQKDLQREKGNARPDVPFVIQLSAQETDADGNAKIALDNAVMDVADNNVGSASDAVDKIETDPALLVHHLSTLSDKLGVMDVIIDKIDSLADLHPYAKIAWTVCSSLYQAAKEQRLTDSNLVSLVKTMSDTYSVVDELKDLPDKIKSLETVIALIFQQISECSLFVREYVYRGFTGRVLEQLWKDQGSKVQDFIGGFEKLKQDLTGGAVRNSALVISRIETNVDELLKSKHLESLKPASMSRTSRKPCLPGTRKKLLDNITDRILQPIDNTKDVRNDIGTEETVNNVLWLHGLAGSGKSTVATTIAQRFNCLGRRGAYLFFERLTGDPTVVIRTLAHQLALFDSTLCTEICTSIRAKPSIVDDPLQGQFEELLRRPLWRAADKLTGPIVVVLDALDECGDSESRRDLLEILLKGLPTLPQIVRILITSRAEPDIRSCFSNSAHIASIEVKRDEAILDVRAYIQSELGRIEHPQNLSTSWPTEYHLNVLSRSSEGLFIWASTICLQVAGALDPIDKLDEVIIGSKSGALKGLDALYTSTLQSACNWDDEGPRSQELFRSILGVILFYPGPVNSATIDVMFKFKEGVSEHILNRLRSLIDYSTDRPIRPLHASFRDYLTDPSRSGKRPCQLHFNMFGIKTSYQPDKDYLEVDTKAKISPELSYACRNLWEHLKSVQTLGQSDPLAKTLSDFGSKQFLFWVEVVSVMKMYDWYQSCEVAAELTKESDPDHAALWEDAQRFLDMCFPNRTLDLFDRNIIKKATPHIYLSALPLTPPTSKINQIYLPKFPNTPKVVFQQTNSPPDHTPSTGNLSHLGFSPDGTMLISCFGKHREGAVHIRSTQDYSLLPQYQACYHPDGIRVAKFNHDNNFLYCLTMEGALVSWESATKQFTEIHPIGISGFDIYGEKIIASCEDGYLRIWTKEELGVTGPHTIHITDESLTSVTTSANGLIAVSQKKSVNIVDIASNGTITAIKYECDIMYTPLFSSNDNLLAVPILHIFRGSGILLSSKSEYWSTTWQKIEDENFPRGICWLRGKPIVCIGWYDGTASLWNVETQSIISGPLYHNPGSCQVAISPDGKTLATGTKEECIKIWDVEMLLGRGESGAGDPFQFLKAENPQLFDGCKYENGWIIGPGDERLLWVPLERFERNPALKYTTVSGGFKELDFSKFVHGEGWAKCYSG